MGPRTSSTRSAPSAFSGALALVRGLVEDPDPAPVDLVLLTAGAVGVVGSDLTHPEHAGLAALAPTIAQENPRFACRSVDVGDAVGAHALAADAESVLASIAAPHEGPAAGARRRGLAAQSSRAATSIAGSRTPRAPRCVAARRS